MTSASGRGSVRDKSPDIRVFFIAFIGIELGELLRAEFAEQLFEHKMYNRAFLKRVEGRALVLLKLQAVAAIVRKRAAVICLSP